jgi:DNA-binding NarL/FixJ family response regulator
MPRTKILIADDHDVVRSGLRVLLQSFPDFTVIAEASNGEQAVRLALERKPDVILMDISMPVLDGIEATARILQERPNARIVILSVHEDEEYVRRILKAGARGFVLKNAGRKEIAQAVRAAFAGERFFSPGISRLIVDGYIRRSAADPASSRPSASPGDPRLTKREIEVLGHIARGLTNKEIADKLSLSFRTINTHRTNIMQKLDIHETAGLVRYAITLGLLEAKE